MWFSFFHPFRHWTDGEAKSKVKKDTGKGKGKKKKRKSNDKEALEDSDDGDYEGLEVDYMSDESRSDPWCRGTQDSLFMGTMFLLVVFLLSLEINSVFHEQFRRRARKGKAQQRRGPP